MKEREEEVRSLLEQLEQARAHIRDLEAGASKAEPRLDDLTVIHGIGPVSTPAPGELVGRHLPHKYITNEAEDAAYEGSHS